MSAMIVQVCRADTPALLHPVIGSALQFWGAQGFQQVNVQFVSPGDDMCGIYLKTAPAGPPTGIWQQAQEDFTAVLILSKP